MKITVFTITDCYFCKQEKDYLKNHNLPFEEKNLEENRDFLTEMLTISNNFAGTPVTKIEKDDGSIVVLKGFTKEEFDETLGFHEEVAKPADTPPAPSLTEPAPAQATQTTEAPMIPPPPVVAPPSPVAVAPAPTPVAQAPDPAAIAAQIEQLKKLQESLMQSSQSTQTVVATDVAPPAQASQMAQPVVQEPVAAPASQAVAPPAPPAQAAVDDSLAAILAELQTKINSANSNGTQGQPAGQQS